MENMPSYILALGLCLSACGTSTSGAGFVCKSDLDCKGSRICDRGSCVEDSTTDLSATADLGRSADLSSPADLRISIPPVKNFAYVPSFNTGKVAVLDTRTDLVDPMLIGAGTTASFGIAVTSNRAYVAVANLAVIDTTLTPRPVIATLSSSSLCGGAATRSVAVTPDEKKAYVGCLTLGSSNCNQISVVSTTSNTILKTLAVGTGTRCSAGIAASPDNQRIYAAREFEGVTVISTATDSVIATIPGGTYSFEGDIIVTPDSKKVYVTDGNTQVSVIDANTNKIIKTLSGNRPYGISITPDGKKLYFANNDSNTLSQVDPMTDTIVAIIPVCTKPTGVSVTSNGRKVYVTSGDSTSVSVVDTLSNTLYTTVSAPSSYAVGKFVSPLLP